MQHQIDEQKFFDQYVETMGLLGRPEPLLIDSDGFIGDETYRAYGFEVLGDVHGKRGLDCGCGTGETSVVLAKRGAEVFAFDVSLQQLLVARRRVADNRVGELVRFCLGGAEELAFPDGSFDFAFGGSILHHVDLPSFSRELHRVLKPGAKAVFWDPLGENPILGFVRNHLPYPGKYHSPHEKPLRYSDIDVLRGCFSQVHVKEFELLSMVYRLVHWKPLFSALERIDTQLLSWLPRLKKYCRYVVILVKR